MTELDYSSRIEMLLVQFAPTYYGQRDSIEKNPYESIIKALNYRLPRGASVFECKYSDIGDRSLSQLKNEGYNIEILIKDLKTIIDSGE